MVENNNEGEQPLTEKLERLCDKKKKDKKKKNKKKWKDIPLDQDVTG